MIGRSFGRYRIVGSLGEGGMGTVWRAEDDLLGRSVALKLLSAQMADSDDARARLLREARAAGALDHPGIGAIYDAGEQDGSIFIAMRLVDGGTVADRITTQGALGLLDAVGIAASAADALGHAHARGILHRDVSPRNLMLTKDGQVVVVDFGLALAEGTSRLTHSGTTAGTAFYMAPEIVLGQQPDRRSDVYSLGAVLYEMLTGAPPFEGDYLQTVVYAAVNTPATPPSAKRAGIPPELDRIVLKTLAKQPDERYASMEVLRADLEALEASDALPEVDAPPVIRLRRRPPVPSERTDGVLAKRTPSGMRAKRLVLIVGAVVVLGLTAAGTIWFVRRPASSANPVYSSLAVLPFENTSEKPAESNYLAEGLSQSLINKLTQMSTLHVPPWSTVGRFGRTSVPADKLAKELRVDALMFGTIREERQRIRGTVSIVDGRSGFQVWSEEFDEPLADLFTVQNRIAIDAATKLLGRLSGKQAEVLAVPAAASIEAYEYYMKGSMALRIETEEDDDKALGLFHRAVELDPRYAPAWVGIGAVHTDRYSFGWNGGLKELATAEEAYGKALEFEPASVAARRGLIRVHWYRGKSEECLKQGKLIAATGVTGTDATLGRAEAYMFGGLQYRSLPLLRQVMVEEPANPAAPWLMTVAAQWAEHFQEAVGAGEAFLRAFGENSEVHYHMAIAFEAMGQRTQAATHYRRAIELESSGRSESKLDYAILLRQDGRLDDADAMVLDAIDALEDKLLRSPDNCFLRSMLGAAYGLVGDVARMREESRRISQNCGSAALNRSTGMELVAGDKTKFVELRRAALRSGNVGVCLDKSVLRLTLDPHLRDYPPVDELDAEQAAECKRLEALY